MKACIGAYEPATSLIWGVASSLFLAGAAAGRFSSNFFTLYLRQKSTEHYEFWKLGRVIGWHLELSGRK
jgi:hypothetical protein